MSFSKLRLTLSLAVDSVIQLLAWLLVNVFLFLFFLNVFDLLYHRSLLWVFECNNPYLWVFAVCFDTDAQQPSL